MSDSSSSTEANKATMTLVDKAKRFKKIKAESSLTFNLSMTKLSVA